jgi:hypothetical protein
MPLVPLETQFGCGVYDEATGKFVEGLSCDDLPVVQDPPDFGLPDYVPADRYGPLPEDTNVFMDFYVWLLETDLAEFIKILLTDLAAFIQNLLPNVTVTEQMIIIACLFSAGLIRKASEPATSTAEEKVMWAAEYLAVGIFVQIVLSWTDLGFSEAGYIVAALMGTYGVGYAVFQWVR